eukprot:765790-Hanusia_phi.AAC.8
MTLNTSWHDDGKGATEKGVRAMQAIHNHFSQLMRFMASEETTRDHQPHPVSVSGPRRWEISSRMKSVVSVSAGAL